MAEPTQLMVCYDPADRSYSGWCSDYAVESNLTYLDQTDLFV